MHVGTHFFAGWLIAAGPDQFTRRERGLIAFAAVLPDLDGAGIIVEQLTANSRNPLPWYSLYHHVLGHNIGFALLVTAIAFALSKRRAFTALLTLLSFHSHLLFDLMGSRGSDGDQWPIPYLLPFSNAWQLTWSGQWMLSSWQNTAITFVLVALTVWAAWRWGRSPLGLFSSRADGVFVETLRARFGRPASAVST